MARRRIGFAGLDGIAALTGRAAPLLDNTLRQISGVAGKAERSTVTSWSSSVASSSGGCGRHSKRASLLCGRFRVPTPMKT